MKLDDKLRYLIKKYLYGFSGANMASDGARHRFTYDIVDIIIKELSRATVGAAAQKASDRHASGVSAQLRGASSARRKRQVPKSGRQSDKFSKYAAMKDKEKGAGSRTKDPKRKKELEDKAKAAGGAAKAASNYAKKRVKAGTSGDYFN